VRLVSGGAQQWQGVRGQTEAFLAGAAASGLFGAEQDQPRYFVIADERLIPRSPSPRAAVACCSVCLGTVRQEFHSCLVTHERAAAACAW